MAGFGKRGVAGAAAATRTQVSRGVWHRQEELVPSDLISKRELKQIDKGYMPVWCRMGRVQLLSFVVLLPLFVVAGLWSYGPDVLRDHRLAGTYAVAGDLRATDGQCRRHAFLVTLCSVKLRGPDSNAPPVRTDFMMLFRSGEGAPMIPVRSTVDPSAVGIRYAVTDVLWTRTYSLGMGAIGFMGLWWMFANGLRRGRYRGGAAHAAALDYAASRARSA